MNVLNYLYDIYMKSAEQGVDLTVAKEMVLAQLREAPGFVHGDIPAFNRDFRVYLSAHGGELARLPRTREAFEGFVADHPLVDPPQVNAKDPGNPGAVKDPRG